LSKARCLPLHAITDIFSGKHGPLFVAVCAARALPDCCLTVVTARRHLVLEFESAAQLRVFTRCITTLTCNAGKTAFQTRRRVQPSSSLLSPPVLLFDESKKQLSSSPSPASHVVRTVHAQEIKPPSSYNVVARVDMDKEKEEEDQKHSNATGAAESVAAPTTTATKAPGPVDSSVRVSQAIARLSRNHTMQLLALSPDGTTVLSRRTVLLCFVPAEEEDASIRVSCLRWHAVGSKQATSLVIRNIRQMFLGTQEKPKKNKKKQQQQEAKKQQQQHIAVRQNCFSIRPKLGPVISFEAPSVAACKAWLASLHLILLHQGKRAIDLTH
jgi:hypothetical protein